jgi:hypothetical protein
VDWQPNDRLGRIRRWKCLFQHRREILRGCAESDPHTNGHAHSYANSDTDAYVHTDSYSNGYPEAYTDAKA